VVIHGYSWLLYYWLLVDILLMCILLMVLSGYCIIICFYYFILCYEY
jgi:hypothetical protein